MSLPGRQIQSIGAVHAQVKISGGSSTPPHSPPTIARAIPPTPMIPMRFTDLLLTFRVGSQKPPAPLNHAVNARKAATT